MSLRLGIADTDAMEALGRELGAELRAGDLVVLTGPLGAGKTTLTRGIGDGLGVRGPVQSPTFVLARTHPSLTGGAPLVHVDAYRLGTAAELDDLDLDFDRSVVVAEWGAGLLDGVSESWLEIVIERRVGEAEVASEADVSGGADVSDGGDPAASGGPAASGDPAASDHPGASGGPAASTDLDADLDLDADEPRIVTITAFGPRWAGTRYAA